MGLERDKARARHEPDLGPAGKQGSSTGLDECQASPCNNGIIGLMRSTGVSRSFYSPPPPLLLYQQRSFFSGLGHRSGSTARSTKELHLLWHGHTGSGAGGGGEKTSFHFAHMLDDWTVEEDERFCCLKLYLQWPHPLSASGLSLARLDAERNNANSKAHTIILLCSKGVVATPLGVTLA